LDDPDRQCELCKDAVGFCCDCAATGCSTFYHIRCARKDKRRVEFYDLKNPANALSVLPRFESPDTQSQFAFVMYCDSHAALPFSADDYQRDYPFPCLENVTPSDNDVIVSVLLFVLVVVVAVAAVLGCVARRGHGPGQRHRPPPSAPQPTAIASAAAVDTAFPPPRIVPWAFWGRDKFVVAEPFRERSAADHYESRRPIPLWWSS
jgi:hypothetical protein